MSSNKPVNRKNIPFQMEYLIDLIEKLSVQYKEITRIEQEEIRKNIESFQKQTEKIGSISRRTLNDNDLSTLLNNTITNNRIEQDYKTRERLDSLLDEYQESFGDFNPEITENATINEISIQDRMNQQITYAILKSLTSKEVTTDTFADKHPLDEKIFAEAKISYFRNNQEHEITINLDELKETIKSLRKPGNLIYLAREDLIREEVRTAIESKGIILEEILNVSNRYHFTDRLTNKKVVFETNYKQPARIIKKTVENMVGFRVKASTDFLRGRLIFDDPKHKTEMANKYLARLKKVLSKSKENSSVNKKRDDVLSWSPLIKSVSNPLYTKQGMRVFQQKAFNYELQIAEKKEYERRDKGHGSSFREKITVYHRHYHIARLVRTLLEEQKTDSQKEVEKIISKKTGVRFGSGPKKESAYLVLTSDDTTTIYFPRNKIDKLDEKDFRKLKSDVTIKPCEGEEKPPHSKKSEVYNKGNIEEITTSIEIQPYNQRIEVIKYEARRNAALRRIEFFEKLYEANVLMDPERPAIKEYQLANLAVAKQILTELKITEIKDLLSEEFHVKKEYSSSKNKTTPQESLTSKAYELLQ